MNPVMSLRYTMMSQAAAQWAAADLAAEMGTSVPILRRRIIFWLKQGVLHEAQGPRGQLCYARVKSLADGGSASLATMEEDGEDSSALVNAETQLQQVGNKPVIHWR